jgi:hypothetical protein
MSRVYFHSLDDTSELRGSERAHFGGFCHDMLMAAIGPIFDYEKEPHWTRRLFPEGHYIRTDKGLNYERTLSTALRVGHNDLAVSNGFILALNTALAVGNDAVKLGARIHGQCEVHCWVDGKNRQWLAEIAESGLESGFFRPDQNWQAVIDHLKANSENPVVLSYSVCEQFPNSTVAGWTDDTDGDDWYKLPHEQQWEMAFTALKEKDQWLELTPERWEWPDYFFGEKVTGFDLQAKMEALVVA